MTYLFHLNLNQSYDFTTGNDAKGITLQSFKVMTITSSVVKLKMSGPQFT